MFSATDQLLEFFLPRLAQVNDVLFLCHLWFLLWEDDQSIGCSKITHQFQHDGVLGRFGVMLAHFITEERTCASNYRCLSTDWLFLGVTTSYAARGASQKSASRTVRSG